MGKQSRVPIVFVGGEVSVRGKIQFSSLNISTNEVPESERVSMLREFYGRGLPRAKVEGRFAGLDVNGGCLDAPAISRHSSRRMKELFEEAGAVAAQPVEKKENAVGLSLRSSVGPENRRTYLYPPIFRCAHDGLEREFNIFNRLEAGVCTMCAPGIKENPATTNVSSVLNACWCQRRWMSPVGFGLVRKQAARLLTLTSPA
jgi:hypothetical protein